MPTAFEPPGLCPCCGEDVPARAKACPGCGACAETGWSEAAAYDDLDLPNREFDYQAFVDSEFGEAPAPGRRRPLWWVVVVALVLICLWLLAG
jgi:hypothetical protein